MLLIFQSGVLKIVDRKKHIFKLAQGEYIAPEKIENIYTDSKYVSQIFVHGESLKAGDIGLCFSEFCGDHVHGLDCAF